MARPWAIVCLWVVLCQMGMPREIFGIHLKVHSLRLTTEREQHKNILFSRNICSPQKHIMFQFNYEWLNQRKKNQRNIKYKQKKNGFKFPTMALAQWMIQRQYAMTPTNTFISYLCGWISELNEARKSSWLTPCMNEELVERRTIRKRCKCNPYKKKDNVGGFSGSIVTQRNCNILKRYIINMFNICSNSKDELVCLYIFSSSLTTSNVSKTQRNASSASCQMGQSGIAISLLTLCTKS